MFNTRRTKTFRLHPRLIQRLPHRQRIVPSWSYYTRDRVLPRYRSALTCLNNITHAGIIMTFVGHFLMRIVSGIRESQRYHLESLETLGDSFLKYAVCQQLFKTYQSHDEGLLSVKKDKLISNETLCKLGCDRKLPVLSSA